MDARTDATTCTREGQPSGGMDSAVCGAKFLPSERVHETPRGLLCDVDFQSSLPPCAICLRGVPESDDVFVAGKHFHKACFRCQVCNKPVDGDVYEDKGMVHCETCFFKARDLLCAECNKPIKTEYVDFAGKKRHVDCFRCSYCRKAVTDATARFTRNKLYCSDCSGKLFG